MNPVGELGVEIQHTQLDERGRETGRFPMNLIPSADQNESSCGIKEILNFSSCGRLEPAIRIND